MKKCYTHCQFRQYLNEPLCDCFMCKLRSSGIQKHMLTETKPLMLKKAVELVVIVEAADLKAKRHRFYQHVKIKSTATDVVNKITALVIVSTKISILLSEMFQERSFDQSVLYIRSRSQSDSKKQKHHKWEVNWVNTGDSSYHRDIERR